MKTRAFESLEVYRLAEKLAGEIWVCVRGGSNLAKDTVGKQIIRAADSIGANLAEGSGRGTSLYETRHWLRRAYKRQLIAEADIAKLKSLVDELGPRLNAYLSSIGPVSNE